MRKILFRGKSRFSDKWVYGGLTKRKSDSYQITIDNKAVGYLVEPQTIGEFTGLTDKNGRDIFEGDIVKSRNKVRQVVFNPTAASYYIIGNEWEACQIDSVIAQYWEVVGNIHDNPELLKGGEE